MDRRIRIYPTSPSCASRSSSYSRPRERWRRWRIYLSIGLCTDIDRYTYPYPYISDPALVWMQVKFLQQAKGEMEALASGAGADVAGVSELQVFYI